jgi:hypothetical protein
LHSKCQLLLSVLKCVGTSLLIFVREEGDTRKVLGETARKREMGALYLFARWSERGSGPTGSQRTMKSLSFTSCKKTK